MKGIIGVFDNIDAKSYVIIGINSIEGLRVILNHALYMILGK